MDCEENIGLILENAYFDFSFKYIFFLYMN